MESSSQESGRSHRTCRGDARHAVAGGTWAYVHYLVAVDSTLYTPTSETVKFMAVCIVAEPFPSWKTPRKSPLRQVRYGKKSLSHGRRDYPELTTKCFSLSFPEAPSRDTSDISVGMLGTKAVLSLVENLRSLHVGWPFKLQFSPCQP